MADLNKLWTNLNSELLKEPFDRFQAIFAGENLYFLRAWTTGGLVE